MPLAEDISLRARTGKTYVDSANPRKRQLIRSTAPIHFESANDSGVYDSQVDYTIKQVDTPQLRGIEITTGAYHYTLQTHSPVQAQKPIGTVGYGGRQGQHWVRFRLAENGYLESLPRTVTGLGLPNYDPVNLITREMDWAVGPNNDVVKVRSQILWEKIWETPGSQASVTNITNANPAIAEVFGHSFSTGDAVSIKSVEGMPRINRRTTKITVIDANHISLDEIDSTSFQPYATGGMLDSAGSVDLEFIVSGEGLKTNIKVNRQAREWDSLNNEPLDKVANMRGFLLDLDITGVPQILKDLTPQNRSQDWSAQDEPIRFKNANDRLIAFLPVDKIYAGEDAGKSDTANLQKRFWRQQSQQLLFVGLRLDEYNGLRNGPLVFDPTFGATEIQAGDDDCGEYYYGASWIFNVDTSGKQANVLSIGDTLATGLRWDNITIPQGDTIDDAKITLDAAYIYGPDQLENVVVEISVDDADDPAAWASGDRPRSVTGTTNSPVTWTITSNWTADTAQDTPDLQAIIADRIANANWSNGESMRFALLNNGSAAGAYRDLYDFSHATGSPASLTINYTAAGGVVISRTLTESISITENPLDSKTRGRVLAESMSIIDSIVVSIIGQSLIINRTLSDALDVLDLQLASKARGRIVSDSMDLSDTVLSAKEKTSILIETLDVFDSLIQGARRYVLLQDAVDVTETTLQYFVLGKVLGETVSVNDFIESERLLVRAITDTLEVTDSSIVNILRSGATIITAVLTDSIAMSDLRLKTLSRFRVDSADISDSAIRGRDRARSFLDSIEAIDTLIRGVSRGRVTSDSIELADSIVRITLLRRILTESMDVTDSKVVTIVSDIDQVISLIVSAIEDEFPITRELKDTFLIDRDIL